RLCGLIRADSRLLGLVKNPYVNYFRRAMAESDAAYSSWVPRYLPVQILTLGPLCIAALPMEPTVQSGRRLAAAVAEALGLRREQVVVNGYANAYAGYVATPQEYAEQRYEGSATLFGQWSLPAFCTAFSRLATSARPRLSSAPPPRSIPTPGADDIGRRPPLASLSSALPASP
ncbi:MAG TPA: neutral/alkaline non-lysosomal ceramidase N-terminal domain-containing protein, partial [Pseudomonadota bacterium]|nr:neutral/alkaline non-lysosomal ceramidase N-terminal domain-containing protein [Pseudomonadota bacterium]